MLRVPHLNFRLATIKLFIRDNLFVYSIYSILTEDFSLSSGLVWKQKRSFWTFFHQKRKESFFFNFLNLLQVMFNITLSKNNFFPFGIQKRFWAFTVIAHLIKDKKRSFKIAMLEYNFLICKATNLIVWKVFPGYDGYKSVALKKICAVLDTICNQIFGYNLLIIGNKGAFTDEKSYCARQ